MNINTIQQLSSTLLENSVAIYKELLHTQEKVITENFFFNAGQVSYTLSEIRETEPKLDRIKKLDLAYTHIKQTIHSIKLLKKLSLIADTFENLLAEASQLSEAIKSYLDAERNVNSSK
jgi:hypothetical protein